MKLYRLPNPFLDEPRRPSLTPLLLDPSLCMWLRPGLPGSGTAWTDASGNGNNATLAGTTAWSANNGYGNEVAFSGNIATVANSAILNPTVAMTAACWVNATSLSTGNHDFMAKLNAPTYNSGWVLRHTGTDLVCNMYIAGAYRNVAATSALTNGQYYHVAFTFDGTVINLYKDGDLVQSVTQSGSIVTSSNALCLGGDNSTSDLYTGRIRRAMLFSRALTPGEIRQLRLID